MRKFQETQERHPSAVLAVNLGAGFTVTLMEPRIVDFDSGLDVATIAFDDLDHQPSLHDKAYFHAITWPIPRVQPGNLVAMVGVPGERRRVTPDGGSFGPVGAGFGVSSASDQTVVLSDESGTMVMVGPGGAVARTVRLGGFSGARVFLVHPSGPQIVGVLRAGSGEMGEGAGNTVLLTPTYFLNADGTFDRHVIP